MKKLNVLLSVVAMSFVMIGCGGSSDNTSGSTVQNLAFERILSYSINGEIEPKVQDYNNIGVNGVSEDNLADINDVIRNLRPDDVDTKEEIQTLVDALGIVRDTNVPVPDFNSNFPAPPTPPTF